MSRLARVCFSNFIYFILSSCLDAQTVDWSFHSSPDEIQMRFRTLSFTLSHTKRSWSVFVFRLHVNQRQSSSSPEGGADAPGAVCVTTAEQWANEDLWTNMNQIDEQVTLNLLTHADTDHSAAELIRDQIKAPAARLHFRSSELKSNDRITMISV